MSDVTAVRIPQENVNDEVVTVLDWCVASGAVVEENQLLAEVESSKATFEIVSPARGVIRIVAHREREVPVGEVLCWIGPSEAAIETWLQRASSRPAQPQAVPASAGASGAALDEVACRIEQSISLIEQKICEQTTGKRSLGAAHSAVSGVGACVQPATSADIADAPQTTRFSRAALALLRERGLQEADFAGRGLVRARDLVAAVAPPVVVPPVAPTGPGVAAAPVVRGAAGVPFRSETLPRAKRLESKLLEWSARQALRSTVMCTVATSGPAPLRKTRDDASEILAAHLIHECGRLLKKYPLFNAWCGGEQVHLYERVNIGYALDAGRGLKVPVFRDADARAPELLLADRRRLIDDYLRDQLRPADLSGGTFSITDLSGSGVFSFDPLIVEGQAAILGVGGNFLPSAAPGIAYNLILAFDHRILEGRAAARFLGELKERLLLQEEGPAPVAAEISRNLARCAHCGMDAATAGDRKHFLVQAADPRAGESQWICTICLQGR